MTRSNLSRKTIADFGEQWTAYTQNDGFYGSVDHFFDIAAPFLGPQDVQGAVVADIGSGTGRIVTMLLEAGAKFVHALEPSAAFHVLVRNTTKFADQIAYHHASAEQLPSDLHLDLVVAIGVIHHIPDPAPSMRAAYSSLRPGGTCLLWLYGREGHELYLALAERLRRVTTRLPHILLAVLCHALTAVADVYAAASRLFPLPLHKYMRDVFTKLDRRARYLVVYDQLNPAFAKYYSAEEAKDLLAAAGFVDIRVHHRHGYSWTAFGRRP